MNDNGIQFKALKNIRYCIKIIEDYISQKTTDTRNKHIQTTQGPTRTGFYDKLAVDCLTM